MNARAQAPQQHDGFFQKHILIHISKLTHNINNNDSGCIENVCSLKHTYCRVSFSIYVKYVYIKLDRKHNIDFEGKPNRHDKKVR